MAVSGLRPEAREEVLIAAAIEVVFQGKGRVKGQSRNGSDSLNCTDNACKYCGKTHLPKSCPAYGMTRYKCNAKNHFTNVCRSGSGNTNSSHPRDFKKSQVKGKEKGKSQKKKSQ